MAIAFVAVGTAGTGTTSCTPTYPTVSANNLIVMEVVSKYPGNDPSTPSGFTPLTNFRKSGGHGSAGVDTGDVTVSVYVKVATGSESGTETVTVTGGNSVAARMSSYSIGAGNTWGMKCYGASMNTPSASWSVSFLTVDLLSGDRVLASSGVNADTNSFSAEACSASGVTFGSAVERTDAANTSGDDMRIVLSEHGVTTASAGTYTVTYDMTGSGSSVDTPAGATVLLVLRELVPLVITVPVATLTTTAFAPTIKKTTTTPNATLTTTSFAPIAKKTATPTTAALVTASFAPVVRKIVVPPTATLAITAFAPVVRKTTTPTTAALVTARFAPIAAKVVVVPTATLVATGLPPVAVEISTPTTAALTTTGLAPVARKIVVVPPASIVTTGLAPTVAKTIVPPAAALVTTGFEPSVLIGQIVIPPTAALVLASFDPTIRKQVIVGTRAMVLVGYPPTAGVPVAPSGGLAPVTIASVSFSKAVSASVESRRRIVSQVELD